MPETPRSMLVVESGIPGTKVIPLEQQVSILGAGPTSDIFVDSPYISRMHAQIVQEGKGFRIRDLESKNGTFVNGNRLGSEGHMLRRGDRIELAEGQVQLRFQTRGTTVSLPLTPSADGHDPVVDSKSREVWVKGKKLEPSLSRKEFDVLDLLSQKRGEACSKDDIAVVGWPERNDGDVGD